jgi:hypothetical protein
MNRRETHLRETHLSDDELIDRLYGLGDAAHECPQCDRRLRAMEQRRVEIAAATSVSGDFLAAQRRGIYSRLGQSPKLQLSWAPATVAALCLAVAGLFVLRTSAPIPAPSVASHAVSHSDSAAADEQLFSDVYAMEQSSEPRAAAPIHALIEEN